MNQRSRKGQMEILGLVMVVLLLSVGVLFILKFVVMDTPESPRESFEKKQVGQNFLSSILATSTDCHDATIEELISDSVGYKRITCYLDNGETWSAGDYAQIVIYNISKQTLNEWGIKYRLTGYAKLSGGDNYQIFEEHEYSNEDYGAEQIQAGDLPPLYDVYPYDIPGKDVKTYPVSAPPFGVVTMRLEIFDV